MLKVAITALGILSFAAACDAATPAPKAAPAPQVVKLEVTGEGSVRLEVTRKTDRTCATELVMKEKNIRLELPLNTTVTADFTPDKAGQLRYACGMDMISGVIVVD